MKNSILTCLALLFSLFATAQKIKEKEVPNIVKSTFLISYPDQTNVKWEKEKENYEASFIIGKTAHAMLLDSNGNILETEEEISVKKLPAKALAYIQKTYKNKQIKEAAMITDAHGTVTFEAQVTSIDLIFDKQGTYIKSTAD
ncbi:PepSY-like domain-containing protein [Flavobacterium chilense]|uniref:Putative beta-lactamase-inhibitor-like, PepSY-like n=1 Tax=Flavobacterium chilense TaxID=946677 RepID=A0A1M6ZRJ0_9FLAO|nr:PepSY-like domain-containing protein [Flavobacterium chilense]SHL33066.1 Putative beta-lactamase-inhibitor-like, PepSY-like [Flavobacterium chilense]